MGVASETLAWTFPSEIDGWLSEVEGNALRQLCDGKCVLEIGSYCGRSTVCIAQVAEWVVAVDPHSGLETTTKPRDTYMTCKANLARYQCDNVDVVRATAEEWSAAYNGPPFDVVFIDGNHQWEAVNRDIRIAERVLAAGGLIAFHDYRLTPYEHDGRWDAAVTKAVDQYIAGGATLVSRHGTIGVVKP